jgi:hypothetical protein
MPSFLPVGNAGGLQIRRCQGFAVDDYGFAPGALALKSSNVCNIGVNRAPLETDPGILLPFDQV